MDLPGLITDVFTNWLPGHKLNITTSATLSLIFIGASFIAIPRTFLCLAAGAFFGQTATLIILPSTIAGGVLAFIAARSLFAKPVRTWIEARPTLQRIADAVNEEGWRLLALLRFASPIPNAIQNYLFALTTIRLSSYAVVSFIFTAPQIVLYVYLGAAGRSIAMDSNLSSINRIVIFAGCVLMCAGLLLVCRHLWNSKAAVLKPASNLIDDNHPCAL